MSSNGTKKSKTTTLQRPKASTVFAAAFLAGAAAAVGVNRALDVHMAQNAPQVESESIFVALRSLPKGSPVTIYDVALRDWPVAMLPATALRSDSSFDGVVLRHPVREGQPILSLQIAKASPEPQHQIAAVTQATQRINQPQRTSAPAFIPYSAAPPIPATLATAQKPMAEHAAKDLKAQVPATKQPEPDSKSKVEENSSVEEFVSVESTPAPAQSSKIQGTLPAPVQKQERVTVGDDLVLSESPVSDKPDHAEPLQQEMPSVSGETVVESTQGIEENSDGIENPEESISAEMSEEQLASTTNTQPHNNPLTQTVKIDEENIEAIATEVNSLLAKGEKEKSGKQETVPEPIPVTTTDAAASQRPDMVSASRENENSSDTITPPAKKPTLAPPSVEPVDITQSILAEAENRKTAPQEASQETTVAALPPNPAPTIAPNTSNEGRSAAAKTSPQTMRYLVVPERIAVQVDQAFTSPQQVTPPTRPAKAAAPTQGHKVKPLPKTTAARMRTSQQTVLKNRQAPKATSPLQATAGNAPRSKRNSERESSSQVATRESKKETSKEPLLRSFFPKISAGLSAVGQEWREFRDGTETSADAPNSRQAKQNGPSQQRSASRPKQSR